MSAKGRPHYRMCLDWSAEDRVYVVTVPSLPGCRAHGKTYAKAARRGERAIRAWLRAAEYWDTPIPTADTDEEGDTDGRE